MPEITESAVLEALKTVRYPGFSRDVVSFGLIKNVAVTGSDVRVQMAIATADPRVPQQIKQEGEAALMALPGVTGATILIDIQAPTQQPASQSAAAQIE